MNFIGYDHQNKPAPIRLFHDDDNLKIILLHESLGALDGIIGNTDISRVFFALSFSWNFDDDKCVICKNFIEQLCEKYPHAKNLILSNIIFLMNSASELHRARAIMPEIASAHVNNASFLSERQLYIKHSTILYNAVINAKNFLFKRHYLAQDVADIVAISYDTSAHEAKIKSFDISDFASKIYESIPEEQITDILCQANCGLALSEVEGACYASAEYLLCGLPVVSTISLGGRSDFYDSYNSLIVEASPGAVADGVHEFKARRLRGDIDPELIRSSTISRMKIFRARLVEEFSRMTNVDYHVIDERLNFCLSDSNKLWGYKNFWLQHVCISS
ncbi:MULTISPECIES: glycosyltransferase [Methylobacterium]|uniref:glycosyltransferase n=1 Tax=Methylobacterium TaxID=407 RepID=UPI0013EC5281|nr:glycosyltransferase family 4 protein [Methylobacterium sp. DB0501]NGM38131.1 glycosyltransferase family 4 protein [Methylobacterium sp. DB0501]